jgi:hypothetical protein
MADKGYSKVVPWIILSLDLQITVVKNKKTGPSKTERQLLVFGDHDLSSPRSRSLFEGEDGRLRKALLTAIGMGNYKHS